MVKNLISPIMAVVAGTIVVLLGLNVQIATLLTTLMIFFEMQRKSDD